MSKRRQRGFALITALVLAMLYFMLMQLLLIDSSRALIEAQRFRARTVAQALAENGAELAALDIVDRAGAKVDASNFEGTMSGAMTHTGEKFELHGEGTSTGVVRQQSSVIVQGRIAPDGTIKIDYTIHSQ
jgi:Tfp pilus assembly protein PilX